MSVPLALPKEALQAEFDSVLEEIVQRCREKFGSELQGVLLFGSTVRQLKPSTDIDLVIAVRGLPERRRERIALFSDVERALDPRLRVIEATFGNHFEISEKLRTPEELDRFSPLYLDWVDQSRILFEKEGLFTRLVDRTRRYIQESGARRVQRGLKWYWILREGVTGDDEFELGWGDSGSKRDSGASSR